MKLIATREFGYAGKLLKPGELFTALNPRDFRNLKAVKRAIDAAAPEPAAEPVFAGAVSDASVDPVTVPVHEKAPKKRKSETYNRRDLRAED